MVIPCGAKKPASTWEYRPGSTLYVVWTDSRAADLPFGDFAFSRDFRGVFDAWPNNILLLEASWWMPR